MTVWCESASRNQHASTGFSAGRARAVLNDPVAIVPVPSEEKGRSELLMFLGDDHSGRALEVGALRLADGGLLVIHVMDLREKFRPYYEEAFDEKRE